ncbi:rCG31148 [Rattus norvegicus]|uniref:RCG31148 n=1 Tax=Rattus norvegicus TaxID=10116 RepID=A6ISA2_RAT|nr:rCG31148 [Rattus norvegicus]
MPNKDALRL